MADKQSQDQKDYQDYLEYQKYLQSHPQNAGPSPTASPAPDSMDNPHFGSQVLGKGLSPSAQKIMGNMEDATSGPEVAKAFGAALLPGQAAKAMQGLGAAGRIGISALQGGGTAVTGSAPDASYSDKLKRFLTGGLVGGALQGVGEGVNKALDFAKSKSADIARMTGSQADAYLNDVPGVEGMAKQLKNVHEDPQGMVDLEDKAVGAINNSRRTLRSQGLANASKLTGQLEGKSLSINPQELMGIDPRADELLNHHISASSETADPMKAFSQIGQDIPESIDIPAKDANQLKRYFQDAAKFGQGTVTDPIQKAKVTQAAQAASGLRAGIEQVSPEAAELNKSMQEGILLQESLRKGAKNSPLAFVSSEAPDRMAKLARAESLGAGGLFDFGNELGAAKSIAAKDTGSGIPSSIVRSAGRAGLRGTSLFQPATEAINENPFIKQLMLNQMNK